MNKLNTSFLKKRFLIILSAMVLLFAPQVNAQKKIIIPKDTGKVDVAAISASITSGKNTTLGKVKAIIGWANANLEWTATDYVERTAKEILCRRGGNCNEEAKVVIALFDQAGIKWRKVKEINIQPESEDRQRHADSLIKLRGISASVFGLRHNDHVWLEYYDENNGVWQPADATTGLVGLDKWLRSRIGFSARPMNKIIVTKDMLVPICILAMDKQNARSVDENRSSYYLVTAFNNVYHQKLSALPEWKTWVKLVNDISPKCQGAFEGKINLHLYTNEIKEVKESYGRLKSQYLQSVSGKKG